MLSLRRALSVALFAIAVILAFGRAADAAPYAAIVIDARDGSVLYAKDPDRRLHPASLTKMMTLYLTFEAVRDGRLKLDQKVRISRRAASQPRSRIGMRRGAKVTIRDLIRAAAVKSANDAAVALAEAQAPSEAEFARMMTARARELGMKNTTFRSASGLTRKGQRSTARDMAIMGRALFMDFPQYYNIFGRKKTRTMGRTVHSTNRRLLRSYRGADGIKTGYTDAAGYNLVSSAHRGEKRVIAVVFGGKSSRWRNARIARLLDKGFARAPRHARIRRWPEVVVARSPAPAPRPGAATVAVAAATQPKPVTFTAAAPLPKPESPSLLAVAGREIGAAIIPSAQAAEMPIIQSAYAPVRSPAPATRPGLPAPTPRPRPMLAKATVPTPTPRPTTRMASAAPGPGWAVQLGIFAREETAIAELASASLGSVKGVSHAGRRVREARLSGKRVWRAQLTGFDKDGARKVCSALKSDGKDCLAIAPSPRS